MIFLFQYDPLGGIDHKMILVLLLYVPLQELPLFILVLICSMMLLAELLQD